MKLTPALIIDYWDLEELVLELFPWLADHNPAWRIFNLLPDGTHNDTGLIVYPETPDEEDVAAWKESKGETDLYLSMVFGLLIQAGKLEDTNYVINVCW